MKRRFNLTILALATLLIAGTGTTMAQKFNRGEGPRQGQRQINRPERGEGRLSILDLSDEQQTQMTVLRAEHQKKMRYETSLIREKEAHLQTVLNAEVRDEKAINKTIDEISMAKGNLLKKKLANHEEMKSILTKEQAAKLDATQGMGRMSGEGFNRGGFEGRRGFRSGGGNGPGQGFGPAQGMRPGQGRGLGPCGQGGGE